MIRWQTTRMQLKIKNMFVFMFIIFISHRNVFMPDEQICSNRPTKHNNKTYNTKHSIDSLISIRVSRIGKTIKLQHADPYHSQVLVFQDKVPIVYGSAYHATNVNIQFLESGLFDWIFTIVCFVLLCLQQLNALFQQETG